MNEIIADNTMRICRICIESKVLSDFPKDEIPKNRKTIRKYYSCRTCNVVKTRIWIEKNKDKRKEYIKEWSRENSEKISIFMKEYRQKHLDRCRELHRINEAKRRATIKGTLYSRMSASIGDALLKNKVGRKWETLVGYTVYDLKEHLEKQFSPGMSWENRKDWHIDHIIPMSAFNYEKPEDIDFKRCWDLKNLQPLWVHDNCVKQDKINHYFQPSLQIGVLG